MLIREIMTANPTTVSPGEKLRTTIEKMSSARCRRMPVVAEGRLVGLIADLDIREALNSPIILRERWQDEDLVDHVTVEVCMTPNPITVTPETPVVQAAELMRDYKISSLPVLDGDRLVGIVTETDMLSALIQLLNNRSPR